MWKSGTIWQPWKACFYSVHIFFFLLYLFLFCFLIIITFLSIFERCCPNIDFLTKYNIVYKRLKLDNNTRIAKITLCVELIINHYQNMDFAFIMCTSQHILLLCSVTAPPGGHWAAAVLFLDELRHLVAPPHNYSNMQLQERLILLLLYFYFILFYYLL